LKQYLFWCEKCPESPDMIDNSGCSYMFTNCIDETGIKYPL